MSDRGFQASTSCQWHVIYPHGDRGRLAIAQVRDYEMDDWDIASRESFIFEYDARDHMIKLAKRHDLHYKGRQSYLD
jgi:hypothetical protein